MNWYKLESNASNPNAKGEVVSCSQFSRFSNLTVSEKYFTVMLATLKLYEIHRAGHLEALLEMGIKA